MKEKGTHSKLALRAIAAAFCSFAFMTAFADINTGFEAGEAYSAAASGTPLTSGFGGGGQNGWYLPVSGSLDWQCATYAGNTFGVPVNPEGGGQFIVGTSGTDNVAFARAQHANTFSNGVVYRQTFDICMSYVGTGTPVNNMGSFSLQPSGTAQFYINLFTYYTDPNTLILDPTRLVSNYQIWDSSLATPAVTTYYYPNALSGNNVQSHWYRSTVIWKFDGATQSRVLKTLYEDIANWDAFGVQSPPSWFLQNTQGPLVGGPLPTDVRFFAGGTENRVAVDNFQIVPYDNNCYAEDFAVTGGFASGNNNLKALKADDNSAFLVGGDELDPNPKFELLTSSPYANPSSISFRMRSRSSRTDEVEKVRRWNWTLNAGAGGYDVANLMSHATTNAYNVWTASYAGVLTDYLQAGTGYIIVEISQTPISEVDGFDGWNGSWDSVRWTINP